MASFAIPRKIGIYLFVTSLCWVFSSAQIEDLTDAFGTERGDTSWLVMFYAPWCGHCKKLNPTYHQVSQALRDSGIRVGKVDCTLHQTLAHMFEVRGFPTIKFIKGETAYTHRGERSKEDILEFAYRAHGPVVRNITSIGRFHEILNQHTTGVFFVYIGEPDVYGDLFNKYAGIAEKFRVQSYFYSATQRVLPGDVKIEISPSVHVFKDGKVYTFEGSEEDGLESKSALESWVNTERFLAFPRIQGANLNELSATKKLIVMFIIDAKEKDNQEKHERVKAMGQTLAMEKREQYHHGFQFIWMGDTESANSITMSEMSTPNLLVLNTETQLYYLPESNIEDMALDVLEKFLEDVKEEKIAAHGGTGFLQRVKRLLYDVYTTFASIWQSSRILFLVMFGIPTAIISIVCYGLCCMETSDEEYTEEEEDEPPAIEKEPLELEDAETLKVGATETPTVPKSPDEKKND